MQQPYFDDNVWEQVITKTSDLSKELGTERMSVPGGWLVRASVMWQGRIACAMVFVNDPKHNRWKLTKVKNR